MVSCNYFCVETSVADPDFQAFLLVCMLSLTQKVQLTGLTDAIGYFPQVFLSGLGVAVLLLILIVRQSCAQDESAGPSDEGQVLYINDPPSPPLIRSPPMRVLGRPSTASSHGPARRPPSRIYPPTPSPTAPGEVAEYEKARATKHLRGEYVFPPVQLSGSAMGVHKDAGHRRFKTVHFL